VKKIKTLNYIKLSTHLITHPPTKPTGKDEGPIKSLFVDRDESKDDIKRKWKRGPKYKKDIIYQTGVKVPVRDKDIEPSRS